MPTLRAVYGLSRSEALELPHWEFQQLVIAHSQQQARETLSLYQAVGLAFGGKPKDVRAYVKNLRQASGQTDKERELVSTKKASNPGAIFAGLAGLGSVEAYKAELSGSTQ